MVFQNVQISEERFNLICARYAENLKALDDPAKDPIRVFDPLSKTHMQELQLIREVSKDLQRKKEEHMYKLQHPEEFEETPKEQEVEETKEEKKELI